MDNLDKKQKISIVLLLISIGGVFGWIYEFIFYYFNDGKFTYQGGNFLPWINIYAIGALLILLTTYRYKKHPFIVFIISILVTGLLEYFSGLVIDKIFNTRFWNYNIEILNFGNINGYICLRSVLFFGISALLLMYLILPICKKIVTKFNKERVFKIAIILCLIFLIDEFYNLLIPKITSLPSANQIYKNINIK